MSAKAALTREQATALLEERDLGFLDVCELLLALSERVDGSIKWSHARVLVHIKQRARRPQKR